MRRLLPASGFMVWLVLGSGCFMDRVAGTSSGTGNPTEIALSFERDGAATPVTGSLVLFHQKHVPVPGFDSLPLGEFPVIEATSFTLTREHLEDAMGPDAERYLAMGKDSVVPFNAILSTEGGEGGVIEGLEFDFKSRSEDRNAALPARQVPVALTPLVEYKGRVGISRKDGFTHYIFIPGTHFYSAQEEEKFLFKSLPAGKYSLSMLAFMDDSLIDGISVKVPVWQLEVLDTKQSAALNANAELDSLIYTP